VCLERRSESRWERQVESMASLAWCRNVLAGVARRRLDFASCVGTLIFVFGTATAGAQERPRLETNEAYVEEVGRAAALHITDPIAVLAFVLEGLPSRVKVYPTENYYYFRFIHNGTPYAGSIRLAPTDRDRGRVEFGYYKDLTEWNDVMDGATHAVLDASHGVQVEQLERLIYRVTCANRSVVFALNDLSGVRPPSTALAANEKFLGPIFDESGVRFFLVYNSRLKIFHYLLDETVRVADDLYVASGTDRVLIGRRTGFAFYRDHHIDRKILVGVYEGNSRVNNYFDGPFDQLPENFIQGEELREAILESDPSARGQIDRLGNYTKEEGRYLIHPYMLYRKQADLYRVHACAAAGVRRLTTYHRCFVVNADAVVDVRDQRAQRRKKR
jgi:hypothetical protein